MKNNIKLLIACFLLALSTGCASESTAPDDNTPIDGRTLFVLNQGSFTKVNASLDAIALKNDSVHSNLFNNLGDVGNDIQLINGKLYVVLNNSQKIEVLDPVTFQEVARIDFPGAVPNKIKQISAMEAIVTDAGFGRTEMYVIDLATNQIKERITASASTIDLGMLNGKLFTTTYANELVQIDPTARTVIARVPVGNIPFAMYPDSVHNKIIVFNQGNFSPKTPPSIQWLNPQTLVTTDSLKYDTTASVTGYIPAPSKKLLYIIFKGNIAKLDLDTKKLTESFIELGTSTGDNFLGGIYDESKNELYLGRGGYSANGKVEVYDGTTGALKRSYTAGIAPSFFMFYQ